MKLRGHKRGCRCVVCKPGKRRRRAVRSVAVKRTTKRNPLQIRPKVYRGRPGFTVTGRPPGVPKGHWGVSIHVRRRETAEAIRAAYKSGMSRDQIQAETSRLILEEPRENPGRKTTERRTRNPQKRRRGLSGPGEWNQLAALHSLPVAILRYPNGRFGLVGNMPGELTVPYTSGFTSGRKSMSWDSEEEAIAALLGLGITHFQRADTSWYDRKPNPVRRTSHRRTNPTGPNQVFQINWTRGKGRGSATARSLEEAIGFLAKQGADFGFIVDVYTDERFEWDPQNGLAKLRPRRNPTWRKGPPQVHREPKTYVIGEPRRVAQSCSKCGGPIERRRPTTYHVTADYRLEHTRCPTRRQNPDTCPTCVRPASDPYRSYDSRGKVVSGCVDDFHTGHLVTPSESSMWHNSKAAKKLRTANRRALARLGRRRK